MIDKQLCVCEDAPVFTVGDRIRKLRKQRGWNQEELAKRAGLHKQTIYRLELNQNATTETLFAVATALEVSLEQLRPTIAAGNGDVEFKPGEEIELGSSVDVSGYRKNDIPVIAEGEASPAGAVYWDNDGVLNEHVEKRMSRPADVKDTNAYGVIVRGDSMEPMFRAGMRLIVSPNVPVGDGDPAYVQLRTGERLVKLVTSSAEGFVLESVNPQYRPRFVREDEVEHIHRIAYARFLR
jgi:phage repressor protein C with HTH and peptisase S24 domain